MGCCQPAEQWNYIYDYPSEAALKSYHPNHTTSPHYQRKSPENINTSYKSPPKSIIFKEFQTPTTQKSQNYEEIEVKRLLEAYNNEDLKTLFTYVKSHRLFEEIRVEIKHKWVSFPRTLGVLSCIFITNILNSYINEEINEELLEITKRNMKEICEKDEGFIKILLYFKGEIEGKRFYKLESGFLMICFIVEFLEEFEGKTLEFLVKICIEYVNLFNLGFENRKIEVILVIFDIYQRIHAKSELWRFIWENGLKIVRSLWYIYEISDKSYLFDEKVVIWFRMVNFIDEISKNNEKRIEEIVKKFEEGNIRDLLKKLVEGLEKDSKKKMTKFDENLKEYIEVLSLIF